MSPKTILSVMLCVLVGHVSAATITLSPGNSLQGAIDSASNSEITDILLNDGTFTGGANFRGKSRITIRAVNAGKATLAGGQVVMNGSNCRIVDLAVKGVRTSWNTGAVLVTGSDNQIIGCDVSDNESLGIDVSGGDRTLIERTKTNRNGNLGINTGSPSSGNNVEGLTIRQCESIGNNYGMSDPVWKAIVGKTVFGTDGKWYRGAGDAAGGMKICNAHDVLVEDCVIGGNTGAGLWFDVYCGKKTVRGVRSYGQKAIPGDPAYFSVGIEVELEKDGVTLIENCYSHDNAGSEYAIFESSNVTIKNCLAVGDIEFRDLGGGREAFRPRNIQIIDTKITGQIKGVNSRTQPEVKLTNVQTGLASLPAWSGPGTPTPTPVPPASESANGSVVTASGQAIVDSAGNAWAITTDRKISRNGTVQTETNGVEALRYVDKVVYQTAHGLWWKWTGAMWLLTTTPGQPTPPPVEPTREELLAKITLLEQQLVAEKKARQSAESQAAARKSTLDQIRSILTP